MNEDVPICDYFRFVKPSTDDTKIDFIGIK